MTPEQKQQRYCIPCQLRGDHTSLDHRYCPEKRKIIQERVKTARENKKTEESSNDKDTKLIKKTIELANTEAWPSLHKNLLQQQKTASIILLALLDENTIQGSFQNNLEKGLTGNGLLTIKYTPAPGTANLVASLFTGTSNDILSNHLTNNAPNTSHNIPQNTPHIINKTSHNTPQNKQQTKTSANTTKYSRDRAKHQARIGGGIFNIIQNEPTITDPPAAAASYSTYTQNELCIVAL